MYPSRVYDGSMITLTAKDAAAYRRSLRQAWPHRHTSFRAPIVIRTAVARLRQYDAQ